MTFFDIIIAVALLYGTFKGLMNGFFAELAALFSFFLGIYIAIAVSDVFKRFLEAHTEWHPTQITILAFGLPFILTIVGISLLARFFSKIFDIAGLSVFNKLGGAIVGLFKTALILSIAFNLFFNLNSGSLFVSRDDLDRSIFFEPIREIGASIYPNLEEWYRETNL